MRGLGRSFLQEHRIGAAVSAVALALCAVGIVLVVSSGDAPQPRGVSTSSKVQLKAASVVQATIPLPPITTAPPEAGLPQTGPSVPRASNQAPDAAASAPLPEIIIVCESTITDENGIETSSEVVTRAPAGTPIPPGCRAG